MLTEGVLEPVEYVAPPRDKSSRRHRRRRSRRPSPPPQPPPWSPLAWVAAPPWGEAFQGPQAPGRVASTRAVDAAYADAERLALPSDDSDDDGGYAQRQAQRPPPRSARSRGRSASSEPDEDEFAAARLARAEQPRVPAHYECQMQ